MVQILSTPLIVSFSGPLNRKTNGGNDTIGGGLKPRFLQIFSPVKMKQMEEIGDFRHSSSIKGVKTKTINVNL